MNFTIGPNTLVTACASIILDFALAATDSLYVLDKPSMNNIRVLSTSLALQIHALLKEPTLTPMHMALASQRSLIIDPFQFRTSTSVVELATATLALTVHDLTTLGPFDILLATSQLSPTALLLRKTDHSQVGLSLALSRPAAWNFLAPPDCEWLASTATNVCHFVFASFDPSFANIHSYALRLKRCENFVSGVPCDACPSEGYAYRRTLSADYCELGFELSAVGPNLATGYLVPCASPTCLSCSADYSRCDVCGAGVYLFANSCVTNTTPGRGVLITSSSPLLLAVCAVANCQLCYADSQVCERCLSGYGLTSSTSCAPLTSGFGLNTVTLYKTACADTSCDDCRADYTLCVACLASQTPRKTAYNGACVLDSSLPSTWG